MIRRPTVEVGRIRFAASTRELVESLFAAGPSAGGTYSIVRHGIYLHDGAGTRRVMLVDNGHGRFAVSCRRRDRGTWHGHAMMDDDAEWLGLPASYAAEQAAVAAAIREFRGYRS